MESPTKIQKHEKFIYLLFFQQILDIIGTKNFVPSSWIIKTVGDLICRGPIALVCGSMIFLVTGWDTANLEFNRLPIYIAHTPAGTSVKDVLHFAQVLLLFLYEIEF